METYKKRRGDRKDGRLLRELDSLHFITGIIYPNRCDNEAYISVKVDLTAMNAYLAKKNAEEKDFPYTMFHLVVAALEKTIGEVNGIIASDGPVIPVEAGVYFWHPNEVVCLSSGEDDRFMDYYPSSLIHFEAMLDCIARGVERFNFYGISGIFDANDPSYGVWQFKTRFGGFVEELPGKFTLPVDGLRFGVSEAAHKLLHR